jgi:xylan 1,4-beta-xylosidase
MDLQKECTINAIQINYAENETKILGQGPEQYYQYLLEYSSDNKTWKILSDKRDNKTDLPHDYIELQKPVKGRYVRLTNHHIPGGTFALAGLRIFGNAGGKSPQVVQGLHTVRDENDPAILKLTWNKSTDAVGYNIRYGIAKDKLYHTYQVIGADSVTIKSLNSLQKYYFTIDAFNENGITEGKNLIEVK